MDSIVNFNLQDDALRKVLIDHLKSDDFFFVEQFPEVNFFLSGRNRLSMQGPEAPIIR